MMKYKKVRGIERQVFEKRKVTRFKFNINICINLGEINRKHASLIKLQEIPNRTTT